MPLNRFTDYDDFKNRWSEKYLEQAVLWNLLQGDDEGKLRPGDNITREELAAVVYRLLLTEPASAVISRMMKSAVYIRADTSAGTAVGSGFWSRFASSEHPLIVTNAHVVHNQDGSERDNIKVAGHQGAGFSPMEAMPAEHYIKNLSDDLAIIEAEWPSYLRDEEPPVAEYSERDIEQGLEVWALGHPFAESFDVSRGIVRHVERIINYWNAPQHMYGLDVPINPGNSGGMLVNAKGYLVGVPSAGRRAADAHSMTYAIPLEKVKQLEESL